MNMLPLALAFLLCLSSFSSAEPTTTKSPTPKKTRTADKETSYVPKEPANSPTNFGFVPAKTSENYIQKEPLGRYVFPDLLGQTQAYTSKYPTYEKSQHQVSYQPQQFTQYTHQQSVPSYSLAAQQTTQQYVYPQQYFQQQVQPAQDFSFEYQFSQPQVQQYYQEPLTKNLNYVSAHTVPQYVYLQQPTNSIENTISPKDHGVRFFMFIPQFAPQQSAVQNYYVPQQTVSQDYTTATISQQPEQVQYVYKTEPSASPQKVTSYEKGPTSLLDSYVPSVLQLQYYKKLQSQSQVNKIASDEKPPAQTSEKVHGKHER